LLDIVFKLNNKIQKEIESHSIYKLRWCIREIYIKL